MGGEVEEGSREVESRIAGEELREEGMKKRRKD